MKEQICLQCKKSFEVNPRARFARKYCNDCSAKRKKLWDNQWKIKYEDCDED